MRAKNRVSLAAGLLLASAAGSSAWTLVRHPPKPPPAIGLAWDASPDPTVTGYNCYLSSPVTNLVQSTAETGIWFSNLVPGVSYTFDVTATNVYGLESLPSNLVTYTVPLPKTNVVLVVTGAVGMSRDLAGWAPLFSDPLVLTNEPGPWFFRGMSEPSVSVTNF